jgi:hypothetical protein
MAESNQDRCYFIFRGFNFKDPKLGPHLGEDWNRGSGTADMGDPVYATSDGEVVFAEPSLSGWGKVVVIRHTVPDGTEYESAYGHLLEMYVSKPDIVRRGQAIGTIGDGDGFALYEGQRISPHLHFEIRGKEYPRWGRQSFGYGDTTGFFHPSTFIQSRSNLDCNATVGQGTVGPEYSEFVRATESVGGVESVGCPGFPVRFDGFVSARGTLGHFQVLSRGAIEYHSNNALQGRAFVIPAPLRWTWERFPFGKHHPLGYPIADMSGIAQSSTGIRYRFQRFEEGALEWHLERRLEPPMVAGRVFEVHGAIHQKWARLEYATWYGGLPTSDEGDITGLLAGQAGRVSEFERGRIWWKKDAPEAFATQGDIDKAYMDCGGPAGSLGFPTTDQYVASEDLEVSRFERGYIEWSKTTRKASGCKLGTAPMPARNLTIKRGLR